MKMSWGNGRWNAYRHRHYNLSKTKAKDYAEAMEELEKTFETDYPDWELSGRMDSCYMWLNDDIQIRISNHSADNQYHDLEGELYLLVNIKGSKLKFTEIIDKKVPKVKKALDNMDIDKYRFINVVGNNINAFYKGYKTKKDVVKID
ncbi:hypothetical protein FC54_GL001400 [Ligilactobacillus saerimneri DSM 16049]|nr:hypothetical protein FC54_GL001400 [Ligilactobacillus saerimneri DSM 16049]